MREKSEKYLPGNEKLSDRYKIKRSEADKGQSRPGSRIRPRKSRGSPF